MCCTAALKYLDIHRPKFSKENILTMTPDQCIAARLLLEWSQADLEIEAPVSLEDIIRFELKHTDVSEDIIASIEITLEYAGIDFISPDKIDGAGLEIRKQQHE